MDYKGYKARVEFDAEAGILHGEVEGVRDVITFEGTSVDELRRAFHDSVDDYLAMCADRGEEPEKAYSGRFVVRIDPQLHRELALSAARQGKSLNAFAVEAMRAEVSRSVPRPKHAKDPSINASAVETRVERIFEAPVTKAVEVTRKPMHWGNYPPKTPSWQNSQTPGSQTPSSITPPGSQAS